MLSVPFPIKHEFTEEEDDALALFLLYCVRKKRADVLSVYHEIPRGFFFWERELFFLKRDVVSLLFLPFFC